MIEVRIKIYYCIIVFSAPLLLAHPEIDQGSNRLKIALESGKRIESFMIQYQ